LDARIRLAKNFLHANVRERDYISAMKSPMSRRSAIRKIAGSAVVATAAATLPRLARADQAAPAKLKGNINHSVCRWCYGKVSRLTRSLDALATGRRHPLRGAELVPSVAALCALLDVLKKAGTSTHSIKVGKSSLRLRVKGKQQTLALQD
jgi:hypothetical protein